MSSSADSTKPAEDVTRTRTSVAAARDEGEPQGARPTSPLGAPQIPSRIGKYRVTGYLGRGGMGIVVSAKDAELQRPVAIKLLQPDAWRDAASVRIEREAQAMAKLSHPNVVTVYEVGREEDQPFIAMELVTGGTLRDWLRNGDRSWRKTLEMLIAAGRGLAAAHDAGLVHRDFKPENVLVGQDGRPRVSDFGLVASTVIATDTTPTTDGVSLVAGTPAYMSPEQWAGTDLDARADQFAFAVTCWEALWGVRPFATREDREPERLRSRRRVPRRVEVALRRALHFNREKRWLKLSELLERLERFRRDTRPVLALVALVVLAFAIAGAAYAGSRNGDDVASACRKEGDDLNDVWSAERRTALAAAFASRPEEFARDAWVDVEHSVNDWEADYRGLRIQTCQAKRSGGSRAVQLTTARTICLDRRRGELSALLEGLTRPDATTIRYARAAARGLTRPISCLGIQTDVPDTARAPLASRDALSNIHSKLAESSARRALGKPLEAVALAKEAAAEADALDWAPLIAASQLELGLAHQAANENADGEKAHARAALMADAAQDDEVRFAAMIGLADAGMDHSQYDEAGKAIETARMIARRLPPDERRQVTIDLNESLLAFWRGDYELCITRGRETLERIARVLGPKAIEGLILREKLAHCIYKLGKYDESEATLREGLAIADSSTGREHPVAADLMFGLAYHLAGRGQNEDGLALMQEALGIRERVLGPMNPVVGVAHTGIGEFLIGTSRYREAREHLERAAAIIEPTWGADSPGLGIAEQLLGDVAFELGEYDVATRHYRRAHGIFQAKRPPGHDEPTGMKALLGRALVANGDRGGLLLLQEATDVLAASPTVVPGEAALYRAYLGGGYIKFGDRARGMAILMKACAVVDQTPDLARNTKECAPYVARQAKVKTPPKP